MGGGETKTLNLYSGNSSISEDYQGSLIIQRKYDDQDLLEEKEKSDEEEEDEDDEEQGKNKQRENEEKNKKKPNENEEEEEEDKKIQKDENNAQQQQKGPLIIYDNLDNEERNNNLPPNPNNKNPNSIQKEDDKSNGNSDRDRRRKERIDQDDKGDPYERDINDDRERERDYNRRGNSDNRRYPQSNRNRSPYDEEETFRHPPNSIELYKSGMNTDRRYAPKNRRSTLVDVSRINRMNQRRDIEAEFRKNKKLLGSNEKAVTSQISNIPPPQIIKNYIKTNKLHNTVITCICPFRPNPRDIAYATASLDKTIKLWSINFDLIDIIKMISFPSVYLVHYRTKRILSAEGLYIKVYDVLSSMTIKHILRDHIDDVLTMLLMVDNYSVISGGVDRVLRLWSVKEEKCIRYYEGHVGKVTFIDYINHHNNIISMSEDKTFIIWDIDSANELVIFNNYFTSTCLIGTQFGFVCGAYDNKLRLYNNQFKLFSVLYGNFYGTENLLMLSGKDLLFVNEKNEICILDINKKSMKYVYQGAKGDIVQVVKGCDWDSLNEDVWNEENNEIGNDMNGPNRDKLIVAVTEDGYVYEYQCYFDTKPKVIRIDNY